MASDLRFLVPLAGLEPATCCLGDGSAQTLCYIAKLLVSSDREPKVIWSSVVNNAGYTPADREGLRRVLLR
jgi:hypothetical protein